MKKVPAIVDGRFKLFESYIYTQFNSWAASLAKIESFGRFLLGSSQPSIADLSLVCEIMQLELVDEKDRERILAPHKRVKKWINDTKNATRPHFDEVHEILFKVKEKPQSEGAVDTKKKVISKIKLRGKNERFGCLFLGYRLVMLVMQHTLISFASVLCLMHELGT